jgi:flagellar hook-associated protein 3 FlgL
MPLYAPAKKEWANMNIRITESMRSSQLTSRINLTRNRIATAQERVSSGKRINRPSDDPSGTETVIRLRTAQAEIDYFQRNASAVKDRLQFSDAALDSYQASLDKVKVLLMHAASDSTTPEEKVIIAAEIEGIRDRILANANTRIDEQYIFGGTRQNAPPFDPSTAAPAAAPTSQALLQIEPNGAPIPTGITGDTVFSDPSGTVFAMLSNVAAALRGTGDPAADKQTQLAGLDRVQSFFATTSTARARVGVIIESTDAVNERHERNYLLLENAAQNLEAADFVEAAMQLTEANHALEATLQTSSYMGRRSLIDLLG